MGEKYGYKADEEKRHRKRGELSIKQLIVWFWFLKSRKEDIQRTKKLLERRKQRI